VRLVVLIVDADHRGCGVGKQLLRAAEAWAINREASEIVLNSSTRRARAHAFYEKRGYTATGIRFVKPL